MSLQASAISSGILARADVVGHAVGLLRIEIVEAGFGPQLGDQQSLVCEHGGGQLAAPNEGLGEQLIERLPRADGIAADRERRSCRRWSRWRRRPRSLR